jgi:hypothetical protein
MWKQSAMRKRKWEQGRNRKRAVRNRDVFICSANITQRDILARCQCCAGSKTIGVANNTHAETQ